MLSLSKSKYGYQMIFYMPVCPHSCVMARIDLADCIVYHEWMVDEPSLDLHRQNIKEIYETLKEQNKKQ